MSRAQQNADYILQDGVFVATDEEGVKEIF